MSVGADSAKDWRIGLVGYGEVGRIVAEDLRAAGVAQVAACDVKLGTAAEGPLVAHAAAHGVRLVAAHARLAAESDFVLSAVTASQAVAVAEACAPGLAPGTWFLDFNSASPGAKIGAARLVDAARARYVEGAVMTSVPPYRIRVPLLLGGPDAAELLPRLVELGFAPTLGPPRLGVASATKMCRSVMIKGLEAMVIESFTSARAYGCRGRGRRVARRDLSRHRLGTAGDLLLPARRPARAAAGGGDARGGRRPSRRRGSSRGRRGARRSARRPWPISPMRARSASAARSPPIGGSTPTRSWRPGAGEASDPSGRGGGSGLATHALWAAIGRRRCAGGPSCAGDCVDQRRRVVVGAHVGARRGLGESPAGWRPALLPPQFPAPIRPSRDDEHREQQDDQPKANVRIHARHSRAFPRGTPCRTGFARRASRQAVAASQRMRRIAAGVAGPSSRRAWRRPSACRAAGGASPAAARTRRRAGAA